MAELREYKCPCCGGAIEFNTAVQKMKCPYCDSEFEMDAIKEHDEELNKESADDMKWESGAGSEWQEGEEEGMRVYICNSCGGEIIGDAVTAATSCPYCDNPVVMLGQLSGELRPDYVLPFRLDKRAAKEGLIKHLKGKKLLPKIFKDENHIDEIKGIYVPFWLFDADVNAHMRYKATRVRSWSDSRFDYTETTHFSVVRGGRIGFERVPVDGSTKMADDLMESIEPFNFAEALDFKTAYLAGFFADKYDVDAEASINRANERIKRSTEQAFAATVTGYTSVIPEGGSVQLLNSKAKYALYPVWILNTTWKGQKYTFAMNGQTGKFVGDLPLDKGAYHRWLWGIAGIVSAVVFGISVLFWLF